MKSSLILLFVSLCVSPTFAQDTGIAPIAEPSLDFRVIEQQEIDLGDHFLIYNRVATPIWPLPTPEPATVKAISSTKSSVVVDPSPEKKSIFVAFFATVYDHQLTEISWSSPTGQGKAVSTIDFNNFSDNGQFETADTAYSYLLFTDNISTNPKSGSLDTAMLTRVQTEQRQLATMSQVPAGQSRYLITSSKTSPANDEQALLTAMHLYYDTHREALIQANQQRQAQIAKAEKLAENPPPPPDTVINFWPEKNSIYLRKEDAK